jgi:radical SAM superfamily enzyme YgiQ (UPF0313 family)
MYKDKKYRVRSLADIKEDIRLAKAHYGDLGKIFLCDGDAIDIDTDILLEILAELKKSFPSLRHVGTYVGPVSVLKKSMSELSALRAAGLAKAYLGVETGDDQLLREINKGAGYSEMLQAGLNLNNAGFNLSSMVLLGIAGKGERSKEHAMATAKITNEMKPKYLAALTVTPVPGTILFNKVQKGEFKILDPFETLEEMKIIFENITIDDLKFVGVHASNYLPVNGTLQRDKQKMLDTVNHALETRDERLIKSEKMRGL